MSSKTTSFPLILLLNVLKWWLNIRKTVFISFYYYKICNFAAYTNFNMIKNLFYFLPFIVDVIWVFTFLFRKKNLTQSLLLRVLLVSLPVLFTYALYISPSANPKLGAICNLYAQPFFLLSYASQIIYFDAHLQKKVMKSVHQLLLYIPAIVHSCVQGLIGFLIGMDDIIRYDSLIYESGVFSPLGLNRADLPDEFETGLFNTYYFFNYIFINIVCFAMMLVIVWKCLRIWKREDYKFGDVYRVWFKNHPSTPSRNVAYCGLHYVLLLVAFASMDVSAYKHYPMAGVVVSIVLSVFMYILCYCEYYSFLKVCTVWELAHVDLSSESWNIGSSEIRNHEVLDKVNLGSSELRKEEKLRKSWEEVEDGVVVVSPKTSTLIEKMKVVLKDKTVYTDPNISIEKLAMFLGTNRSTLSPLINQTYGMGFKTLIATLRIEEAKRLLLESPDTPIESISMQCGFKDKVNFFRRFKEITGKTPRVWLISGNSESRK